MSAPTLGKHKGNGIRYEMHLSAPKGGLAQMLRHPEGEWVGYRDYAALQAENERLRRAGDGLMFEGETMAHEVSWNPAPWDRVVAAWVAAKEGGRK